MNEYSRKMVRVPTVNLLREQDIDKLPVLDVRNLGIDFGGLTAVKAVGRIRDDINKAVKVQEKTLPGVKPEPEHAQHNRHAINGVVVDAGKTLGVPTPYNQKIVEITHGIENGLYEISPLNADFF